MHSETAPNQTPIETSNQMPKGAPQPRPALRRSEIDEVTRAKMALGELRREPRDPMHLVRTHPLTSAGLAFALGILIGKSPTARSLGRAGIALGMRGAIARAIREVL